MSSNRISQAAKRMTALALPLAALTPASPALADTTNGYGVSTAAWVYDGGTGAQGVSTYRTLPNAAGRYTLTADQTATQTNATTQWETCSAFFPTYCAVTTSGVSTGLANNNLTTATAWAQMGANLYGTGLVTNVASGSANLSTGALRGVATSNGSICSNNTLCGTTGQSFAKMDDQLSFTVAGANAGTLTDIIVTFTLEGNITGGHPSYGSGIVQDSLGFGSATAFLTYTLNGNVLANAGVTQSASGWKSFSWSSQDPTLTTFTGVYTLQGASQSLAISNALSTEAAFNTAMDYGSTSLLRIVLPSNVSYTSASGTFLSALNSAGPGAVPEPASWAMMIAGFGAVGLTLRRRTPGNNRPRFAAL